MHFRKFLYKSPEFNDVISWNIEKYYGTYPGTDLSISLTNGRREYFLTIVKENNKSVAQALAPLNDLIDALSKAGMEFAKACNTQQNKLELDKAIKKAKPVKKEKKSEPAKK